MTRHNNILSFDEARARGAVSSRSGAKQAPKSPPIAHKNAAHSSQMRRSASQLNPQRPVLNQARQSSAHASSSRPERLTYDPSFAQSFTATARSGSYQNARRGERSVHPSYATNMPFALAILMLVRMQRVHKIRISPIQRRMRIAKTRRSRSRIACVRQKRSVSSTRPSPPTSR